MKKSNKSFIAVMLVITLATAVGMYSVGYNVALAKTEAVEATTDNSSAWIDVFNTYDPQYDYSPTTWDASKYPEGSIPSYTNWNNLARIGAYPPADVYTDIADTLEPSVRACILNTFLENDPDFVLTNKDKMVLDWYNQHTWDENDPTVMIVEEEEVEEPEASEPTALDETPEEEVIEETPAEPEYTVYTVKAGDSFWKIAHDFYGDGRVWQYIVECNNWDRSKQALRVGTELKLYDLPDEGYDYVSKSFVAYSSGTSSTNPSDQGYEYHTWSQDTVDSVDTSNMTYLGDYHITGYDPYCKHCNGKTDGITASGIPAIYNYTVAVKGLDFGTKIYIEGYGIYEVHDRPANKGIVDIACESHDVCYTVTRKNVPVYIVND